MPKVHSEDHPAAVHTNAQVAAAKALLASAPRITTLRPGAIPRIAEATGLSVSTIHAMQYRDAWKNVTPAPLAEVEDMVDWTEIAPGYEPLPPSGQPLETEDTYAA